MRSFSKSMDDIRSMQSFVISVGDIYHIDEGMFNMIKEVFKFYNKSALGLDKILSLMEKPARIYLYSKSPDHIEWVTNIRSDIKHDVYFPTLVSFLEVFPFIRDSRVLEGVSKESSGSDLGNFSFPFYVDISHITGPEIKGDYGVIRDLIKYIIKEESSELLEELVFNSDIICFTDFGRINFFSFDDFSPFKHIMTSYTLSDIFLKLECLKCDFEGDLAASSNNGSGSLETDTDIEEEEINSLLVELEGIVKRLKEFQRMRMEKKFGFNGKGSKDNRGVDNGFLSGLM